MTRENYPNHRKYMNQDKCQTVLLNLLRMNDNNVMGGEYIREWGQVSRCSNESEYYSSNSKTNTPVDRLRDYKQYILQHDDGSYKRIISCDDTEKDLKIANSASCHYQTDGRRVINSNLTWKSYLNYHIFDRHDRIATISTFAGVIGTVIVGITTYKKWHPFKKFLNYNVTNTMNRRFNE